VLLQVGGFGCLRQLPRAPLATQHALANLGRWLNRLSAVRSARPLDSAPSPLWFTSKTIMLVVYSLFLFSVNVITPGASFLLTASHSLNHGRSAGYRLALGLATVDVVFALAVVIGLAAVAASHPTLLQVIAVLGGAWFVRKGLWQAVDAPPFTGSLLSSAGRRPIKSRGYRLGVMAGAANPQALLFFSTAFTSAVQRPANLPALALMVGGVAAISLALRCGVVRMITQHTVKAGYERHRRKVEIFSGLTMAAFGLVLIWVAVRSLATPLF